MDGIRTRVLITSVIRSASARKGLVYLTEVARNVS